MGRTTLHCRQRQEDEWPGKAGQRAGLIAGGGAGGPCSVGKSIHFYSQSVSTCQALEMKS